MQTTISELSKTAEGLDLQAEEDREFVEKFIGRLKGRIPSMSPKAAAMMVKFVQLLDGMIEDGHIHHAVALAMVSTACAKKKTEEALDFLRDLVL